MHFMTSLGGQGGLISLGIMQTPLGQSQRLQGPATSSQLMFVTRPVAWQKATIGGASLLACAI